MLWNSDYLPGKVNVAPVDIEAGRLRPVQVLGTRRWVGNITGLALTVQGPLPVPLRIRGVVAKPMGAFGTLRDRAAEWLAFEGWTGTSINSVVGGADVQDLPLPLLLAAAVGARERARVHPRAMAAARARRRRRRRDRGIASCSRGSHSMRAGPGISRGRSPRPRPATRGKDTRETDLAAEDGALYAFIEKARAVMPQTPVRVFVIADVPYFRGRAAYHLYPHNAYADVLGRGARAGDGDATRRLGARLAAPGHSI